MNAPTQVRENRRCDVSGARYPDSSEGMGLLDALLSPDCYPHPVAHVRRIETHSAAVFLTGGLAYKVKKPVDLGFLNYSTLELRRKFCDEELRLNRRTAPDIYLEVVPIARCPAGLRVGGTGSVVEYAIKMQEFPEEGLLDRVAKAGRLDAGHVDALATVLAHFHDAAARAGTQTDFGTPDAVMAPVTQNFQQLLELATAGQEVSILDELREWSLRQYDHLFKVFGSRKEGGFIRECHGDLHLGNVTLVGGHPVLFDCIEFSEHLRWVDVMNEVAFLAMDLKDHGLWRHAHRLVNQYLEHTGDYAGVKVLQFYEVYRALVRAKVAAFRGQAAADDDSLQAQSDYVRRLQLARQLATGSSAGLVIMHGLSGSGKTTVSSALAESLGAIRLRSDVERKRIRGLDALSRSASKPGLGIYDSSITEQTYRRLAALAREVLAAGRVAIVDAAFLKRAQRDVFRALARETGSPFMITSCAADEAILRDRLARRRHEGKDASEAGMEVMEYQRRTQDVLGRDETDHALVYHAGTSLERFIGESGRRLAEPTGA